MRVTRSAEAPTFELPGVTFTGLAAPSRGSRELCVWRLEVAPGLVSDTAHTLDRDEVFAVLDGEISLSPEGEVVRAGDVAVVPAGEPIRLCHRGTGPAVVLVAIRAGFAPTMADGTRIGTPPWAC